MYRHEKICSNLKELLSENFSVNLITRPRRLEKTLAMSMLAEFFGVRIDSRALLEEAALSKTIFGAFFI